MTIDEQITAERQADAQRGHYRTLAAARPASKTKRRTKPQKLHRRNGDRASPDTDAPRLPVYVRFADLIAANVVRSWPSLKRLIDEQGFPVGVMLSSHTRAWRLDSVEAWLASRPTVNDDVRLRGKRAKVEA